jgi:enediyne biosynthesis protein E4
VSSMSTRVRRLVLLLGLGMVGGAVYAWQGRGRTPKPAVSATAAAASTLSPGRVRFTNITKEAGVDFRHSHGGCGEHYFVEQVASGVALFDANGDGHLDLYFPQPKPIGVCKFPEPLRQRIYLGDGKGGFRLDPQAFGGRDTDYAIGASAADYDNDSDLDLYVTCWGRSTLFQNDGKGHFKDVTERAGVGHSGFSTSSAWFDYDNDGHLDLYVANYAHYLLEDNVTCWGPNHVKDVCTPTTYPPAPNVLYHSNGDGTFTEVTAKANALIADRRSLGLAAADYDLDGRIDLFVANDLSPNSLLHNKGNGTFEDVGMQQNVAFGADGHAQANMGLAVADYDRDGDQDVVVSVFSNEPYTLYRNQGAYFTDESQASNIGPLTLLPLAFGTCFFEADNDGFADLFFANGHVSPTISQKYSNMNFPQRNSLLLNDGKGWYLDASAALPREDYQVHRGAAYGDIDHDGDLDLIVTANDGHPTLLRNDSPPAPSLRVRLVNARGNVSPIGATCVVETSGGKQTAVVLGGGSYASQSEYTLHFGLGKDARADRVSVKWPSGMKQTVEAPAGRELVVREGQ